MKLKYYLDRKRLTLPDTQQAPVYVQDYLRAHDREPFYKPFKVGENTLPDTSGVTRQ